MTGIRWSLVLILGISSLARANFSIDEATIATIHTALQQREITCEQLIQRYFDRIKQYNLSVNDQPPINAFTELNVSALDQARQLDRSVDIKHLPPLFCIPIALKDNIDSVDNTNTSASFALLGTQPTQDAFIVKQLRHAGAIIIGKTAMDEFASSIYGINSRNGRIGNVYDTRQNPGGSSGGSAAAVSANFVVLGIGTDNSGSVRIPAGFNGVIGLRPSMGLVSQQGIFPMGNLDATAGPMARNVEDLAILLDVIAKRDNTPSYATFLHADGLKAKRIGVVQIVGNLDLYREMPPKAQTIIREAIQRLRAQGATLVDINLPAFNSNRSMMQAGEIAEIDTYLNSFPATRKNFQDICLSDRTRAFGTVAECINFRIRISNNAPLLQQQARHVFANNKEYVETLMQKHQLDALLLPITATGTPTYDAMSINTWRAAVSSNAGLPGIAMNAGYLENLPVSFELIGKQFAEGTLIEMAYAYQQHSPPRKIPPLVSSTLSLATLSLPQYNQLITLVGVKAYEDVLKYTPNDRDWPVKLTPEVFRELARRVITSYRQPE